MPPTIHKAERVFVGANAGGVLWWDELTVDEAIARRNTNEDIVVRGPDKVANRDQAKAIEEAVGLCDLPLPHLNRGPLALPHFQQLSGSPAGHSFYDVDRRKARKKRK